MMAAIDPKDVPIAHADDMHRVFEAIVGAGLGGVFLRAPRPGERSAIETAVANSPALTPRNRGIVLLRTLALIDAMQSRRLHGVTLKKGYAFLVAANRAAGTLRLNLDWGFPPQRLLWAANTQVAMPRSRPTHPAMAPAKVDREAELVAAA